MEIKTNNFNTRSRLTELINNFKEIDSAVEDNKESVDLTYAEFVRPISLLPLVSYSKQQNVKLRYTGNNEQIQDYLNKVYFPDGISHFSELSGYLFPITKLRCGTDDPLLDLYESGVLSNISEKYRTSFQSALSALTSELRDNVEQHARIDHYWLLAQYYPKQRQCEICIADTGIGYKESYKGTKFEVETDKEAIINILEGHSSKKMEGERGYGIDQIRRMFIEGYKGEMIMMSGDSLVYLNKKNPKPNLYPCSISYQGSFVGLKFTLKDIDISKYYGG